MNVCIQCGGACPPAASLCGGCVGRAQARERRCANCGTAEPGCNGWRAGRCGACYQFRYRTGQERPLIVGRIWRGEAVPPACVTCARPRLETEGGGRECGTCRMYRWRHGCARPPHLWQPQEAS